MPGFARLPALIAGISFALLGCAAPAESAPKHDPKAALTVGDTARDFELESLGGEKVKLSKAAETGPVVLVVLRGNPGYQCPICSEQFSQFRSKAVEIKKLGARVLFVYPGPEAKLKTKAEEFVKGKDYPDHFQILLDPDYAFTNSYGLRWDAKNETAYPSTFVLDKKLKVSFAKISTSHGERAKVADVLKTLGGK
jgi:thioredoxin-dependent peroxiredoxin